MYQQMQAKIGFAFQTATLRHANEMGPSGEESRINNAQPSSTSLQTI